MTESIIRLLPENLANQIAAGEVVQRPSSIVKELMENSLDAGAKNIYLEIKKGGKQLVQITDDGKGMNSIDARMCFERHATSKILDKNDLFAIRTFGFRGEAMASIAAVAQVEMHTRMAAEELGTQVSISGGKLEKHDQVQCKAGTTIAVSNLFFNVPARRKYLKSDPTEAKYILQEFTHVALSFPEVGFRYVDDGKDVYHLLPEKLISRIIHLFGPSYQEKLFHVKEESSALGIYGYVGTTELARVNKAGQFLFVNRRYIRHHLLAHAVKAAFEQILPAEKNPFFVLFLDINPEKIDVNVHPTKTEVKFEDDNVLYSLIRAAVRRALNTHHLLPTIDFDTNVRDPLFLDLSPKKSTESKKFSFQKVPSSPFKKSEREDYLRNFEYMSIAQELEKEEEERWKETENEGASLEVSSKMKSEERYEDTFAKDIFSEECLIVGKFAVIAKEQGLLIMHLKRARERVVFEEVLSRFSTQRAISQQLLFPEKLELSQKEKLVLETNQKSLLTLGLQFSYGENNYYLTGLPEQLQHIGPVSTWFAELLRQAEEEMGDIKYPLPERLARWVASKTASNQIIKDPKEPLALLKSLSTCSIGNFSPWGKPIFVHYSGESILEMFG